MKHIRTLLFLTLSLALFSCRKAEEPAAQEPVEGKVNVSYLRVNGISASLNSQTSTFTVILPTETDFSSMGLTFVTNANSILMGDRELATSNTGIDLSKPQVIRFIQNGVYQDYTIIVQNTGLPIVRVETPGRKAVTSKTVWMDGAKIRIERPDGTVDYEGQMEIKGRGNSTWNYVKKPYALRLKEKDEILGMPSHKRWILLANWKDRTILRNDAAFWLSRHTGLPYTVRGQFVELVFNGEHKGNYYLCEQIKLNKKRVNIEKMDAMETDPQKITGGWLLELDTYYDYQDYVDEKHKFRYPNLFNLPWIVKDPDDEISTVAYQYIQGWIKDLETLMKDSNKVRANAYEEFLDVDTAIDYLIVEELTGNNDFYNYWPSAGPHSTYLYKERGGKLYHGPVWDFDYHVFCPQFTNQWVGATKSIFYPALLKDEKFRDRLVERWEMQKDELKKLPDYIDEQADRIRESERINHNMWPILNNPENGDENMTFQESVERIKKAFLDKWEWMDKNIRSLRM